MSTNINDTVYVPMTVAIADVLPGDRMLIAENHWGNDESVCVSVSEVPGAPDQVAVVETVCEGQHLYSYTCDRNATQIIERPVAAAHVIPALIGAAA